MRYPAPTSPRPYPHRSRVRAVAALAAGLLAFGAVGAGDALNAQPAQAADSLALTPSSGPLTDLGSAGLAKYTLDYTALRCPASSPSTLAAMAFVWPTILTAPLDLSTQSFLTQFAATDGALRDTATVGRTGTTSTAVFPTQNPNKWVDSTNTAASLQSLAAGTYTFGLICVGLVGSNIDADHTITNGDGKALMSWVYLNVAADGWTMTADAPVTTVATSTAVAADPASHLLTATVTATAGTETPTGTVQFTDGGDAIGDPQNLSGSGTTATATYAPTSGQLSPGDHEFGATYVPTGAFTASDTTGATAHVHIDPPAAPEAAATFTAITAALDADYARVDATVTVSATAGGAALGDADGTVQFYLDGTDVANQLGSQVPITAGTLTTSLEGIAAGSHVIYATYLPSSGVSATWQSSTSAASTAVIVPTTLADGDTDVAPGGSYLVRFGAGTFAANAALTVELHSDPVTLDPVTAGPNGELAYAFVLPSDIAAGDHELVFTDPTDPGNPQTLAFTVAAASNTAGPGGNSAVSFATGVVARTVADPAGVAWLFGGIFLALAAAAGAWILFWKRRRAGQEANS